ncbi:hypothetical protein HDU96_010335 [Phlyctochytrium bullatum]|nr:hypothetical protein HDU96_010335 [Phlyctochytrium bullatum]
MERKKGKHSHEPVQEDLPAGDPHDPNPSTAEPSTTTGPAADETTATVPDAADEGGASVTAHTDDDEERRKVELAGMMRERWLRWWVRVAKERPENVEIKMVDGTSVRGTLLGVDSEMTHLNASNLVTPLGVYPEVTLRMSDVKYVVVEVELGDERQGGSVVAGGRDGKGDGDGRGMGKRKREVGDEDEEGIGGEEGEEEGEEGEEGELGEEGEIDQEETGT